MARSVITVSRTLGAGGEDLADQLAKELGFRYVDSEIIHAAAEQAGVSEAEIAAVEKRQGLLERILGRLSTGGMVAGPMIEPPEFTPSVAEGYQQLIIDVVRETASAGEVVLVAHGASMALGARPGVVRVLVTAPADVRVSRLATSEGISSKDAEKRVSESDSARAQYFQRFFRIDRELPTHYDLVVNTESIGIETAAQAVLAIARGRELAAV
ncbi:MAG: cytidylate kinase-like family protein [Dehalococcoidia bacterium]